VARAVEEPPKPRIGSQRALELMFHGEPSDEARACLGSGDEDARVRCLLALSLAADRQAADLALALYDESGTVVGLEREHVMDGGWRGHIRLVPAAPVGAARRHLSWIVDASRDHRAFVEALRHDGEISYRVEPIELRFFRSVGRTTPSAYAADWGIAYNVSGSLHRSADAVRETMFHEIFHLNDGAHDDWSRKTLTPVFDAIVARCTRGGEPNTPCLQPFAPGDTMVRGGTYYAFQPGNGVWEYAAELAVRYYDEHRAVIAGRPLGRAAFKCGPEENGKAWRALAEEFFGGIDRVPACDASPK
jgi:hypothetical protein